MQPKATLFNPDFSFELGSENTTAKEIQLKRKLEEKNESKDENSDSEVESSKKELESLISKKDHVRVKTQSIKVIFQIFF